MAELLAEHGPHSLRTGCLVVLPENHHMSMYPVHSDSCIGQRMVFLPTLQCPAMSLQRPGLTPCNGPLHLFINQKSSIPEPPPRPWPCAGLSVRTMVDRPVHVAAGSCYHLMQQRLLEHPSSCTRPGHLAGSSLVFGSVWFAHLVLGTRTGFDCACAG